MARHFIPDPFSATVRIGARWQKDRLVTLDDKPLPEIQDGTLVELVLPARGLSNEEDRQKLRFRLTLRMVPAKSVVFLGLSPHAVPKSDWKKFIQVERAVEASSYLLARVILTDNLEITIDGSQRATLQPCRCQIALLNTEAKSLNHALTLLSRAFEPKRMSHGGNVFRQGYIYHNNSDWLSLDDLRLAKVAEFIESSEAKAVSGQGC